ncbi:ABC transporter substrate-binding protein [Burkholderia stagnalis]|nr:extracellular solute-binding protein [Burkholderia stagnalis]VWB55816.1 spermidine/putrescine ABC transporter substrate-binding protein [Burkholderia stagnalis]
MTTIKTMFGFALAAAVAAAALSVSHDARADDVHVLNWKGYGTDEPWALKEFEARTGYHVVNDYFNSEQEMLTKLRTNPGTYDVVMVNSAFNQQARSENLLQPIVVTGMSNVPDLDPRLRHSPMLEVGGQAYGIPWVWGVTSFAVNNTKIRTTPDSIESLWNPAYKGHVGLRDDAIEAVQFAALATGQKINDIRNLNAVKAKLTALMPQLKTFWSSENDWNQYTASGVFYIASYWSGSAARARNKFSLPVTFVVPKEGAIGWLDSLSIPKGARNVPGAKAFINYMIDPGFYTQWDARVGAPVSANVKAVAALPAASFNRAVLSAATTRARIQFQEPITDDKRKTYLQLWQEIKAQTE